MNIYSKIVIVLFLLSSVFTYSQQDPQYTQYMYNTMSVNPAYAGSKGFFTATALARVQWVGIDGAPDGQNISFHTPIGYSGVGLGLNIINDKIGPSNETYMDASGSYTIRTRDKGNLAFGIRVGARLMNVDWTKGTYNNQNDNIFDSNISNKLLPSFGLGAYYYTDNWYLGVSAPNVLNSEAYDDVSNTLISSALHYFVIAGYVFDINNNLKFKPAIISKIVKGSPLSLDISANFLVNKKLDLGLAYRWGDSVSALFGFQVNEMLRVGYAYDFTTSNYKSYNSGTHEIILTLDILKKQTIKSPRFF
ncbi:MAG: type IX secretion system membrane protein PorP/SprF [Flavobacteriaceae bacterium]|nr:type IX secretion system membrane protein PorP/SprF [Flavobacteriaceae bacterium]